MAILKLPNAGDTATLTITDCATAESQYGVDVKFTAGADILYVPAKSADRQLARCGFIMRDNADEIDYAAVIGQALTFYRAPNAKMPAKPFWDISLASATDAANAASTPAPSATKAPSRAPTPTQAAKPASAAPAPTTATPIVTDWTALEWERRSQRAWLFDRYADLLSAASQIENVTDPQPVAATLWIEYNKRGLLVPPPAPPAPPPAPKALDDDDDGSLPFLI